MITIMMMMHWAITPIASALIIENVAWAAILTFITIFAFWSINYIAEATWQAKYFVCSCLAE